MDERSPAGPRGAIGAAAEDAAASYLVAAGWSILARNLRIGRDELDIVALEPGRSPTIVVVEVRSHTVARFGSPLESVDAGKVTRLYRAAFALHRHGHARLPAGSASLPGWRVDLLALHGDPASGWTVDCHLRGLLPP
jgi:putative endonuclease